MSKYTNACVKGFLHTDGRKFVNGEGEPVILRGMGIGNWMNPEGFMIGAPLTIGAGMMSPGIKLPERFDRGRSMEQTMTELCGKTYAENFWPRWMRAYLTEDDIRLMAELGFNSVRLPLASRLILQEEPGYQFNEDTLAHLDDVLDWCEKYRIYAILDLHAYPGGQTGFLCDDGLDGECRFFEEPESQERAIVIWETLANRYKDRWIVGGYDLMNEPIGPPRFHKYKPQLKDFYDRLIPRIRAIDKHHMLTIEGAAAAGDLEIFDHEYDPECHNWCLHMHQYGFDGDALGISHVLEVSRRLNVPVWYGEGRSGNAEMAVFYEMLSFYGFGFNQWSWKACEGRDADDIQLWQYKLPERWPEIYSYIKDGGPRPTYAECIAIFDEMLELLKIENCTCNTERAKYTLRQQGITLPAAAYDPGVPGDGTFSSSFGEGNGWKYRVADGTRLIVKERITPPSPSFGPPMGPRRSALDELLLELRTGEYTTYTVRDVQTESEVLLHYRAAAETQVEIMVNGQKRAEVVLPGTADFTSYSLVKIEPEDAAKVKLTVLSGTIQIQSIQFK